MITAIITGDIINSKKISPSIWLPKLKATLMEFGNPPKEWEIYRGDSFQLECKPEKALEITIFIKASIKQIKKLDVRMAIGLGTKSFDSENLTESNGTAFINSGECFENLKKATLAVKSPDQVFNEQQNLLIKLALLTMDNWTPVVSQTIKAVMENPNLNQSEISRYLGKTQSNVSEAIRRSGFYEIKNMIDNYENLVLREFKR